jgi:uncharacterized membrane protein YedE/YeeE
VTVDWTHFTPGSALAGGLLIGLSAAWLILFDGRVLGAAGVLGGLVPPRAGDWAWRASLLAGLAASPFAAQLFFAPARPTIEADAATLVVGGLLVGFGTRLANGCTSGHGVCGIARLSPRSFAATAAFMATGILTVFIVRHVVS